MSRSVFGWSLPPGVSQRMIDEAAGGDPQAEAFADAFAEKVHEIFGTQTDEAHDQFDKLSEWVWTQISRTYGEAYKEGQSDERMAHECQEEQL